MRRSRITITLDSQILGKIDQLIDKNNIRNRSHAIEYILKDYTMSKVNKAVILAGGQGTKLRPYTYEIPKPLLPVKGVPILERLILQLKKNNITNIIIAISYLGDKIKEHFGDGEKFGVKIEYAKESENLQTGGALLNIQKKLLNETFLVIHGDILTDFSFTDFIEFHKAEKRIGTIALTAKGDTKEYGQIKLRGTRLIKFYPVSDSPNLKSHLINCGIYAFEPEIFQYFPKNKKRFALEDIISDLIVKQEASGYVFEGKWYDVGSPEIYEKAIKEYEE